MGHINIHREVEKSNKKIDKIRNGLIAKINSYIQAKRQEISSTDKAILGLQDKRRADQANLEDAQSVLESV